MELLPCPFCGGEALPTAHLAYNWFAPVCRRCNVRGPSVKIERDSDPQEMRNLMNQADENWNRRASPASVPEGQDLWDSVYKTLRGYRMTMMVDSDGDGYPLIDAMSPEHGTVKSGIDECTYLADAIYNDLLAAAPTPPVSEDRWLPIETAPKDEFVLLAGPSGYTTIETVFSTGRMCSDYHVGRWISHSNDDLTDWGFEPTHWMPLPKAPTMQEDKP